MATTPSDTPPQETGLDAYTRERFQAARRAGLTRLEAERFAHGRETLHTLRRLQEEGCPANVIARIVT